MMMVGHIVSTLPELPHLKKERTAAVREGLKDQRRRMIQKHTAGKHTHRHSVL